MSDWDQLIIDYTLVSELQKKHAASLPPLVGCRDRDTFFEEHRRCWEGYAALVIALDSSRELLLAPAAGSATNTGADDERDSPASSCICFSKACTPACKHVVLFLRKEVCEEKGAF
jgi:hypothetical protein